VTVRFGTRQTGFTLLEILVVLIIVGLLASLAHVFASVLIGDNLQIPSLGASGAIAGVLGAELHIIHVIEQQIHPAFYTSGRSSVFEVIPDLRERSETALRKFLADNGTNPVPLTLAVIEGRVHTEIVRYAEEHSGGLVVIATHGLSGWEHLLLGSTAEKVVRKSHVPVLTIKRDERDFIS